MKKIIVAMTAVLIFGVGGCSPQSSGTNKASISHRAAKKATKKSSKKVAKKSSEQSSAKPANQETQQSSQSSNSSTEQAAGQSSQQVAQQATGQSVKQTNQPSNSDTTIHTGVPAALLGDYQAREKNEAAGFADIYTFTPTEVQYGSSNMPEIHIHDVTWHLDNGNYVIKGVGEPHGLYKGGAVEWVFKKEGDRILRVGYSNWLYKTNNPTH